MFFFYFSENGKKKPDRARDSKKTENQNDSSDEEESNQAGELFSTFYLLPPKISQFCKLWFLCIGGIFLLFYI